MGRRHYVPLRRRYVIPTRRREVVGCFIWDVPATSLGRTKRHRYDVATTSCCRVGSFIWCCITWGFIASTRTFNLLTCAFNLLTRAFNLATCAFSLLTGAFELVTRRFEPVTRVLLFHLVEVYLCFCLSFFRCFQVIAHFLIIRIQNILA